MSAVRLLANLAAPLHSGSVAPLLYAGTLEPVLNSGPITPLLHAGPVHTPFNPRAVEALFHAPLHAGLHALSLAAIRRLT